MLKFAANLTTMFAEPNELDRFPHAASLGFQWVEWLFPYSTAITDIRTALLANQLKLILINAGKGDSKRGEVGIGALPDRVEAFRNEISIALEYAHELEVPFIHVMAGKVPPSEDRSAYVATMVENLIWANEQAGKNGPKLLVEPLNLVDTPNYLITSTAQAMEIIESTQQDIGLQFDFYHLQIMEGNLGSNLAKYFEHISHIQFSSVPGRHEPQFGEVNCFYLFEQLERMGYDGYIGCEYRPKEDVEKGLTWAHRYGIGNSRVSKAN